MSERLGPFALGRVHLGDAREMVRLLPDGSVPMVFMDPPYGHNNNNGDLAHHREAALGYPVAEHGAARPIQNDGAAATPLLADVLSELARVMTPDYYCCCCCCCCGGGGPDPQFARWSLLLDQAPWRFFHAVVWDKVGLGMGWRYRRNYELILVAHQRRGRLKWEWEGSGVETGNVVRLSGIKPAATQHPTPKPVELVEHFLRLHTRAGDLVLDPFAGSGATGVACRRMGRQFLGFEIDPRWVDYANRRLGVTCSAEGTGLFAEGGMRNG